MALKNNHSILRTENLVIGYPKKQKDTIIANNINLEINIGELIGIVGANGIGKSTLLRTLTMAQRPLQGKVFLKNRPINDFAPIEMAKEMSVVLTEQHTSKNLTVFEFIALGRQPYTNWIGQFGIDDHNVIRSVIEKVSLEDIQHKNCYELSDGQFQKVMIARALAQQTDLILMDEPTTHLDLYHEACIFKLLKELVKTTTKTILFSTHKIDLAIQICDKMIVMTKNEVYYNTPCNLISQGVFDQLFPETLIEFDRNSGNYKIKT